MYQGHGEHKVLGEFSSTLPRSGLYKEKDGTDNGFEATSGSSTLPTNSNYFTPHRKPSSLPTTEYIFKYKVVYLHKVRCELVCHNHVCRYCQVLHVPRDQFERVCHQTASGTKCDLVTKRCSVSKLGSCLSPEKSIVIDKEYKGHIGEDTTGPKISTEHASYTQDDAGHAENHGVTNYEPHIETSVSSSTPCTTPSPQPCAVKEQKGVAKRVYVFKHKALYIHKRRCELVCQKHICRYCQPIKVPSIRHERICRLSYSGRECKFARKVQYVLKLGGCLSYEKSIGADMAYKAHEQRGEVVPTLEK